MSLGGVHDDGGAGQGIRQRIVVLEVFEAGSHRRDRQLVGVQVIGLAGDQQTAGVGERGSGDQTGGAPSGDHAHIELRVVGHQRVAVGESHEVRKLLAPSEGVVDVVSDNAVDTRVPLVELVVTSWRPDQPIGRVDHHRVAHLHQTDGAGARTGRVRGLEVDRGEVDGHPSMVSRAAGMLVRVAWALLARPCWWGGPASVPRRVPLILVALTIAIVGLPNVGKSTLFNALTKNSVLAANYPFATIEPNVGIVNLPDSRLAQLATIYGSERLLPAPVSFVDIAGIVKGASVGEGLGNKFLANIREADAIAQVVRGFADPDVIHVDGKVDAASDMETINTELILADLQTLENAQARYDRDLRAKKITQATIDTAALAVAWLNEGKPLSASTIDVEPIRDLGLLTSKPFIYVFNVDEELLGNPAKLAELAALVAPAQAVFLDAKLESELIELEAEDAAELLASTGQTESGLNQLARIGFDTLGLQTYLTAGPKEVRAWTIPKGAKAPQAAGVIHTDFEKGFIKAEIISFADLMETGSIAEARAKGKARVEGKEYVMQDGDVVEFRFNV